MAVKIRLTRTGSKKRAFFRIVAANSDSRRDGRPLEFLGWYNPHTDPAQMKVDTEKLQKWLSVGAQPTDTVRSLLNKMNVASQA
jgi:small subunit ribosomal protein S16